MVRALGRTQETLTFMTRHRSKDGRIFPVDVTSNFIEFEGKEYLCSFVHDISERIEAEKKILESEKRFRHPPGTGFRPGPLRTQYGRAKYAAGSQAG
ncbi:MAG: PAS domain S-box protein [Planctomycetes bacterium]|nr:PAS domain S-box protein [Planctomycetota bacterium]